VVSTVTATRLTMEGLNMMLNLESWRLAAYTPWHFELALTAMQMMRTSSA